MMDGMGGGFLAGAIIGKMILDRTKWAQSVEKVKGDERTLKGFSERTTRNLQSIGRGMTLLGTATLGTFGLMIKQASDAEETYAKFGTVFKDVFESADKVARNLAEGYGLSTIAAKDMLGATGDLLTGLGVMPGIALDLSEKTQQLAVDLASFTNFSGGAKGASEALTKAMLGERESIKSLGIVITEEMVKEQLLATGKSGLTGLALKQAQAEATLQLAYMQSKNAIGDYARTSDSFANQSRLLKARLQDVAVTLGQQLIPIATKIVAKITEVVQKVTDWTKAHPELTEKLVKVAAVVGTVMVALGPLLIILPKLVTGFGAIGTAATKFIGAISAIKGVSLAAASGVGILVAALAALAIGYMKVKKARDEANAAAQRSLDAEGQLFQKIKAATDAAGLSERQFLKLRDAYHGNAAALAMAIQRGKEGKELQEAFTTVCEKHKEKIDEQKAATDDYAAALQNQLIPQVTAAKEKTKDWTDYLADMGILTVKQKKERVDELEGYLRELEKAYKDGKITLKEYTEATNAARTEVEGLSTVLIDTMPEAGRTFDLTFEGMTVTSQQFPGKVEPPAKKTKSIWTDVSQRIKDQWTTGLADMLSGARSFSDVAKGIWGTIKEQFFTLVAQMVSKWTLGFIGKIVSGTGGLWNSVKDKFGNIGKALTGAAEGGGEGGLFGNLGKGFLGTIGKMAGPLGIGLLVGKIIGFKNISKTVQDVWKAVSDNVVNSIKFIGTAFETIGTVALDVFKGIGKVATSALGAIGDIVSGLGKGIGGLLAGIGGIFKKKQKAGQYDQGIHDAIVNLRDIVANDIRGIQLNEMLNHMVALRDFCGNRIPIKVEAVVKRLDTVKDLLKDIRSYAKDTAKALSKVSGAQQGAIIQKTQLVMAHGTPANPEIFAPQAALEKALFTKMQQQKQMTVNLQQHLEMKGTMISDRDYARTRLLPQVLSALETGAGKERLKRILGVP